MNEKIQKIKTSEEPKFKDSASSFFKKALMINVVIFGFVLLGIALIIRHFNPTQDVNILRTELLAVHEKIKNLEEKIDSYEHYFAKLNQQVETLASRSPLSATPEIDDSYQTLISEFKALMESEISSPISIPFFEEKGILSWFTHHIRIKETPNQQAYNKAYELLKRGELLQAIELLRPLAHDPSSSLYHWLEKTIKFHKSLLIKEPS